jgi:hypothetical protein
VNRLHRATIFALVSSALLVSCADLPKFLRRHTYPPDFKYIERHDVSSAMWQLARDVTVLDRLMRQSGSVDAVRRAKARRLLVAMTNATTALRTHGRPTNHPLMGEHIEEFRRDLALARAGVDAEPPSYYLVGAVSGACLTCHASDRWD